MDYFKRQHSEDNTLGEHVKGSLLSLHASTFQQSKKDVSIFKIKSSCQLAIQFTAGYINEFVFPVCQCSVLILK